jgi:hypothetical protein
MGTTDAAKIQGIVQLALQKDKQAVDEKILDKKLGKYEEILNRQMVVSLIASAFEGGNRAFQTMASASGSLMRELTRI